MNFVFWFFLVSFLIAALQDLKRREVDNWLNLFLLFSGFIYIISRVFIYGEISFLINFAFLVLFMFGLSYLFYFSKIFAGGDCKLLFATTPLLVSFDFMNSLQNVLFFIIAIFFIGAIYGPFWIFGLFIKNFKENKNTFFFLVKKNYLYLLPTLLFVLLGFLDKLFFMFFFILIFLIFVFFISKTIEKNSLIKKVNASDLREGDWLEKDLKFKGKILKANFDGLSLEDILFLKSYRGKIRIKDGIPYAPVFVFAWIVFYFRGWFMEFLASILGV